MDRLTVAAISKSCSAADSSYVCILCDMCQIMSALLTTTALSTHLRHFTPQLQLQLLIITFSFQRLLLTPFLSRAAPESLQRYERLVMALPTSIQFIWAL